MSDVKHIAVLLADGFEEGEAIVFIDIMRRFEIKVDVLSCMATKNITAYFGTRIEADATIDEKGDVLYDAIMMPGGPKGTDNLFASSSVYDFITKHIANDKFICALCSSGAKVLAAHKMLQQHQYTCGGGLEKNFADGQFIDKKVVVDGKFITGKGLGVSFEFAFTVASHLLNNRQAKIDWQAQHIYFDHWPLS